MGAAEIAGLSKGTSAAALFAHIGDIAEASLRIETSSARSPRARSLVA